MKYYGWLSISGIGLAVNLCVNGYGEGGLFIGILFISYYLLKARKYISYRIVLSSSLASIVYLLLFYITSLITINSSLIIMSLIMGLNTGLFLEVSLCKSKLGLKHINMTIDFYAFILMIFTLVIIISPNHLLSYFLYPHYVLGGFKEAMLVVVINMFAPYVLIVKSIVLYRYVKSILATHLVSKQNVIQ